MMAAPKQMLVRPAKGPASRAALLPPAPPPLPLQPLLHPCPDQIYVPPHPLVKHWLGVMRNKDTPAAIFRTAAAGGVCMRRHALTSQAIVHAPGRPKMQAPLRLQAMNAYLYPGAELGRILIYEAARDWLPTVAGQVQTPLGIADAEFVDPMQPVKVRPVPLGTSSRLTGWVA